MSALLDAVRKKARAAEGDLAAAFGSPDRAEAIVEALEAASEILHDDAARQVRNVLRDLARAMEVAMGGTDANTD